MQSDLLQEDLFSAPLPAIAFSPPGEMMEKEAATSAEPMDALEREAQGKPAHGAKSPGAFKTISEAAVLLAVPQHVLRFWESRFPQIKPLKLHGGRRYYRPEDIDVLAKIKSLLYAQGYTINGAKKALRPMPSQLPLVSPPEMPLEPSAAAETGDKAVLETIKDELIRLRDLLTPYVS